MEHQLLMFKLNNVHYGIETKSVKEILRLKEATIYEMPKAPKDIIGLIALRGAVYPVLDRCIEPFKRNEKETRILIIEINNLIIGLVVDEVVSYLSGDEFKMRSVSDSDMIDYQILEVDMLF